MADPPSDPSATTSTRRTGASTTITTPMLVIHGDKDYRVPIGEGLRLWWDLQRHGLVGDVSQFLYFPDENHWVLKPGNASSGTRRCSRSWPTTCSGRSGCAPELV